MNRSDYYIFGLGILNIYFFIEQLQVIVFSPIISNASQFSVLQSSIFLVFLTGIILVLRNLSRLLELIRSEKDKEQDIFSVGQNTILILVAFLILRLLEAHYSYGALIN